MVLTYSQTTIPTGGKTARLEVRSKTNLFLSSSDNRISVKKLSSDPQTDKVVYEITAEDTSRDLANVQVQLENPYTGQKEVVIVNYGEKALVERTTPTEQVTSSIPLAPIAIAILLAIAFTTMASAWYWKRRTATSVPPPQTPMVSRTPFSPRQNFTPNPGISTNLHSILFISDRW